MDKPVIPIKKLPGCEDLPLPAYMTPQSAGMDIYAAVEQDTTLAPGGRCLISAGISIALPAGYEAQIRPRSGLAAKHGIGLLNSPGTIDADYRGPIKVILVNHGKDTFVVRRGERIAQMVISPVCQTQWSLVAELDETERNAGGFGHTGR
ncbi:MAG: dUTP diphosphatase [Candidatus Schekmanbacteria bacterium]|nr:dUTP diphosphatase [Candidatus Schekmanbacteria bacterium]